METPSYITLSRQAALRRQMDVVANNLANMNTPAYRAENMMFVEYLQQTQRGETGALSFVQDIATFRDLSEGPMTATGNALDFAISGPGYFVVETDDGPRYTRHGSFRLNDDNEIVTHAGHPVLDQNGNAIEVPDNAERIDVTGDGIISTEVGEIAQFDLVAFDDDQALTKLADGLYDAEAAPVLPADDARVKQGMVEGSNVEGIVEMTRMIEVLREYQIAQQMSEGEHERRVRAVRTLVEGA